jgi:hypothetical protein
MILSPWIITALVGKLSRICPKRMSLSANGWWLPQQAELREDAGRLTPDAVFAGECVAAAASAAFAQWPALLARGRASVVRRPQLLADRGTAHGDGEYLVRAQLLLRASPGSPDRPSSPRSRRGRICAGAWICRTRGIRVHPRLLPRLPFAPCACVRGCHRP